ncbi:MAG: tetratricopeptide repeat protein [Planctomycetota bacterium]
MSDILEIKEVSCEEIPQTICLELIGAINATSVVPFHEEVESFQKKGYCRFILEMSKLIYINSTGVSTLVNISDAVTLVEGKIILVNPHPKSKVVFKMLGLDEFFQIFETVEKAKTVLQEEIKNLSSVPTSISPVIDSKPKWNFSPPSSDSAEAGGGGTINLSELVEASSKTMQFTETLNSEKPLNLQDKSSVSGEKITGCLHCQESFGPTQFKDGTRLRCQCGFMNVIKWDGSGPSPYEILGVEPNDSMVACRNAWNRIQKKYPFYENSVANWQARKAFYAVKKQVPKNGTLFEVPGGKECLACMPLRKLELFCCVICGRKLQEEWTKEQKDKIRKKLRAKLVELSGWDDLLEPLQEYVQAEELILKEEYSAAEQILVRLRERFFEKVLQKDTTSEMFQYVTMALMRCRQSSEQFPPRDVEALHRILMIAPDQQNVVLLAAIFAIADLEYGEANHYLDTLLKLNNPEVLLLSGLVRYLNKKYMKALESISKLQEEKAQFLRARIFVALKQFDSAHSLYESLLKQQEDPITLYYFSGLLAQMGEYSQALEFLKKCAQLLPKDPRPILISGNIHAFERRYAEAEQCYQQAMALGASTSALIGLSKMAYHRREVSASLQYIEEALKKEPTHFEALICRGNLQEIQGTPEKAMTSYTQAITQNPDTEGMGLLQIGLLSLKLGNKEKSRKYLAETFKLGNQNVAGLVALGMCYAELKDYISARMVWEELHTITQNPEVARNLANLNYLVARMEIRKSHYYRAIRSLQQCMKYRENREGVESILSEVFFRLGTQEMFYNDPEKQRPRKFFNFAAQFQPKNAYIHYYLGHALLQMEEFKKALSCFQRAYEIKPKPQFIRQICLARILLRDPGSKPLLMELPVDPASPSNLFITAWFETCYYLAFEQWEKARHLLFYILSQRKVFGLSLKEMLKLRILLIRVLYQLEQQNAKTVVDFIKEMFTGDIANLMQGLYLLLNQEFDQAQSTLSSLYEKNKNEESIEAYRYLFAILLTKCKLEGKDSEEVLSQAKTELIEDPEVFNWELKVTAEGEDVLPTYSLLLDTFQEKTASSVPSTTREEGETKGLEAPYPGLLSNDGFILLKQEHLKIGTNPSCEIIISGKEPLLYDFSYYKEAGKFALSASREGEAFLINDRSRQRAYLNHRDRITLAGRKFTFLEQRDPTLVYGDVAFGLEMQDDWKTFFTDLRSTSPEEDFSTLEFKNVSISKLSAVNRDDFSMLEFYFV